MCLRRNLPVLVAIALGGAACATAPEPDSGFLSRYDGLTARTDTVRASIRQRRDDTLVQAITALHIEPAVSVEGAGQGLEPEEVNLVLRELDRQVCYELSRRFTLLEVPAPNSARVRIAATRISATGQAGSVASAVAGHFLPGPIGLRAPGTTGGLAAEAELITPQGQQAGAVVFARNATVVGTDNPSLSRVGDAHQLTRAFADAVAAAFAAKDREAQAVPEPDPCAAFGPRFRPEGIAVRFVTGLYEPGLSGARPEASAPAASAQEPPEPQ